MREFIRRLTDHMGINGLGRALGLNGSSVLAWKRGESLPSADLIAPLAALAHANPDELRALLIHEQEIRAERRRAALARPPMGPAASAVVPVPKRPRALRRRRKLAAWAFAVASGAALGQPLAEVSPRPIMNFGDMAPRGGILSRWRRARARCAEFLRGFPDGLWQPGAPWDLGGLTSS